MKQFLLPVVLGALLAGAMVTRAFAALKVGDAAPMFTTPATVGGDAFEFSLADTLKNGPVVLYFYPAAFTKGCTIEAHEFAEATDTFKAMGATVIGMSGDPLDKLKDFSKQECQSKFPLGSDADKKIMKAYGAKLFKILPVADRTSFVISPEGKILYEYTALDAAGHVENTLAAVKKWKEAQPEK